MTGINGNHYRLLIAKLQSDLEAVEKVAEEILISFFPTAPVV
ncbi:MAG: hypothetical protein AB1556_17360 [Bacillota bacterium]